MKKQMILMGCALGLMLVPARAQDKEETPLGKQMEAMDDAFKGFRRETDPVKGATEARAAQDAARFMEVGGVAGTGRRAGGMVGL